MDYLWIYVAVVVGAVIGFGVRHFIGPNKKEVPFNTLTVVDWILCQPFYSHLMDDIVRLVYDGKRTIHKNPIRKKPADKYPTSER